MLVSELGKGLNTEKIEFMDDNCLVQSIFIMRNVQKDLLIQSA